MNIKTKLFSVFFAIAAGSALVEIVNLNAALNTHRKFSEITTKTIPKLLEMERSKNNSLRLMTEAYSSALLKGQSARLEDKERSSEVDEVDKEEETEWIAAGESLRNSLVELRDLTDNGENRELYRQLIILSTRLEDSSKRIMLLKQSANPDESLFDEQQEFEELEETFLSNIQRLIGMELKYLQDEIQTAKQSAILFFGISMVATALLIGLSVILGKNLLDSIARPLDKLKETATKITPGDRNQRPDNSNDELVYLGDSLNKIDAELKEAKVCKSYLDRAIDSLSEGLIIVNKYGIITTVNAAVTELTGYPKERLIGKSIQSLLSEKKALESLRSVLNGRKLARDRQETMLLTKNQEKISVCLKAAPLKSNSNKEREIVCLLQDLSERKKNEQKLVAAIQATMKAVEGKSRPLTNLSYEIRANTNQVLGKTELLSTTNLNPEQAKYVNNLKESGETLLAAINNLIELSKQEAEKMSLVKTEWKKYIDTN